MYNNKTVNVFFQVRMESTRLPAKSILKFNNEKDTVEMILEALCQSNYIDRIIIAPPTTKINKYFTKYSDYTYASIDFLNHDCIDSDVLSRFVYCQHKYQADYYVRITGDCPLIDVKIIDKCIEKAIDNNYIYLDNTQSYSFPDGFDVSIFSSEAIELLKNESEKPTFKEYYREHIGQYLLENKCKLLLGELTLAEYLNLKEFSKIRLTIDEYDDHNSINEIITSIIEGKQTYLLTALNYFLKYGNDLENKYITRDEGLKKSKEAELIQ